MIEYLGCYTYKIAISNYRILAIDTQNKTVTFSMKEYRNQGKKTTQTVCTKDFIKCFQHHILPKGFTRIGNYGFLSSSWKKEKFPQIQRQLANKDLEVIQEYVLVEKSVHRCCPSCKKGVLTTLLTFDSRGPPKEYKKIARRKTLKYKQQINGNVSIEDTSA